MKIFLFHSNGRQFQIVYSFSSQWPCLPTPTYFISGISFISLSIVFLLTFALSAISCLDIVLSFFISSFIKSIKSLLVSVSFCRATSFFSRATFSLSFSSDSVIVSFRRATSVFLERHFYCRFSLFQSYAHFVERHLILQSDILRDICEGHLRGTILMIR